MERLTIRNSDGSVSQPTSTTVEAVFYRLATYEDIGTPEEINRIIDAYGRGLTLRTDAGERLEIVKDIPTERLRELAQAEKDGRLALFPRKVGDVVYEANKRGFISSYKVISIHVSDCSVLIGWELIDGIYSNLNGFEASAFGKTVFLTREEAEAALKKREAENETD